MPDPLNLDEIARACEEATPGPWGESCGELTQLVPHPATGELGCYPESKSILPDDEHGAQTECVVGCCWWRMDDCDRDFIANARTWVPALHARVVELEAEVAALREAAKCKTVRTEVRPVPRFDPEGEDES